MNAAIDRLAPWAAWTYRAVLQRWVALWLLLGLALHIVTSELPLGTDEAGNSFIALHWANTSGSLYGRYWVDRPPLLLLTYRIGAIFDPVGIRMLAAVAALGTSYIVYRLTERIAGRHAARCAMPFAVLSLSSGVIGSVYATGELFAVFPGAASVYVLLQARDRTAPWRWMILSGALGAMSLLMKQSFFDAMAAAAAYFVALLVLRVGRGMRLRTWFAEAGSNGLGVLIPVGATLAWAATTSIGVSGLAYALFGFRVDALRALANSSVPLDQRMLQLVNAAIASGVVFMLVCIFFGLWRLRRDGVIVAALGMWLAAGLFGVLGGGYYWAHYLIQLIPVCAALTGVAIAAWRRRFVLLVLMAVAGVTIASVPLTNAADQSSRTAHVANYLHAHAAPGDTLYVMYARANLVYEANMSVPYPYLWSSMLRAKSDAQPRLRTWLASRDCPTWLVKWQSPTAFGMDKSGYTRALLARNYTKVSTVDGVRVLHRNGPCSDTR